MHMHSRRYVHVIVYMYALYAHFQMLTFDSTVTFMCLCVYMLEYILVYMLIIIVYILSHIVYIFYYTNTMTVTVIRYLL